MRRLLEQGTSDGQPTGRAPALRSDIRCDRTVDDGRADDREDPFRASTAVLVLTYLLALVSMAAVAYRSRYDLGNIDGISYISIARQYSQGLADAAVNAYWSPLLSWLMVPSLWFGVPEISALHLVSIVGMAIGVAVGARLVWVSTSGRLKLWASLFFIVAMAVFGAANIRSLTPDLLVVSWTICFVALLVRGRRRMISGEMSVLDGVWLGALCAVGYFTKFFLVPVIVVTLTFWFGGIVLRLRDRSRAAAPDAVLRVVAYAGISIGVAALVVAPWVTALSLKYGYPTGGSSFTVNMASKTGPTMVQNAGEATPVLWAPPNEHAVSFGEDRTFQVSAHAAVGSPTSVAQGITYYLSERLAAFPYYVNKVQAVAAFSVPLFVAYCLAVLFRIIDPRRFPVAQSAFLVWGVYFAGYAGITTAASGGGNARYYWPLFALALLGAIELLPPLLGRLRRDSSGLRRIAGGLVILLLPLSIVWEHGLGRAEPFSMGPPPRGAWQQIMTPAQVSEPQVFVETELSRIIPEGSRLVGSNYRATLRYAYYLNAQVYGRAEQGYDILDAGFQRVLRDNNIDYYLLFTPAAAEPLEIPELGSVVGRFQRLWTCADNNGAPVQVCTVDVIEVSY